jgi:hypothetical protein
LAHPGRSSTSHVCPLTKISVSAHFARFFYQNEAHLEWFGYVSWPNLSDVVAAKRSGKTAKLGANTRKNKYRFFSGHRAIPRHARDCTGLYSKLKICWNGLKLVELFEIEVDSRSSAAHAGSKRPRSKDRPQRPWLVGPRVSHVVIEVFWSPPGPHSPTDRPAGVAPTHGTVGDHQGRTTPNESITLNQTLQTDPQILSPVDFPRFSSAYSLVCVAMVSSKDGVKKA